MKKSQPAEHCCLCGCRLHRTAGTYALPTLQGRSHATKHHLVAERFFGRSTNRKGTNLDGIFDACPWNQEGVTRVFCYECHEELLHNPILLAEDVERLAELFKFFGLSEDEKSEDRKRLAGRVQLFRDVISAGINLLHSRFVVDCVAISAASPAPHGESAE